MSVMVGGVTESLTADEAFVQGLNATVDDARVQVAYTLSFLVGLFQVRHGRPPSCLDLHCVLPLFLYSL